MSSNADTKEINIKYQNDKCLNGQLDFFLFNIKLSKVCVFQRNILWKIDYVTDIFEYIKNLI